MAVLWLCVELHLHAVASRIHSCVITFNMNTHHHHNTVYMALCGSARLLSKPACIAPGLRLAWLKGSGDDPGPVAKKNVRGCCVNWCYASPGLPFR